MLMCLSIVNVQCRIVRFFGHSRGARLKSVTNSGVVHAHYALLFPRTRRYIDSGLPAKWTHTHYKLMIHLLTVAVIVSNAGFVG